jgi:hypothetical protein
MDPIQSILQKLPKNNLNSRPSRRVCSKALASAINSFSQVKSTMRDSRSRYQAGARN